MFLIPRSLVIMVCYRFTVIVIIRSAPHPYPPTAWGCSSVGRASDRYATDAGSIPQCGKEFCFQSQLSVQTLLRCLYIPGCNGMH